MKRKLASSILVLLFLAFGPNNASPVTKVEAQDLGPAALVNAGNVFFLQSDFEAADEAYASALAVDTNYAPAYAHRCYLRTYQDQYEEAIADCERAVELAPDGLEGFIYLTRALDWNKEFEKAVETGKQAVFLAPENGLAQSFLGEAYIDLGEWEAGETAIQLGVKLAPNEPEVHRNMAYLHDELGDTDASLAEMKKAIDLAPRFTPYYRQIARYYFGNDQYEQMLDCFRQMQAIAQEVGNRREEALATNGLGAAYLSQWQHPEALEQFEKALSIFHEIGDKKWEQSVLGNIGQLYKQDSQFSKSVETLERAVAAARESGNQDGLQYALWNLGVVYGYMGKYQEALKCYLEAREIRRELGWAGGGVATIIHIGLIYGNLGQYQQALDYYEEALTLSRETGEQGAESVALTNIAGIYFRQESYNESLQYYEEALSINNEDTTVLNNIGVVYTKLGRYEEALKTLEEAWKIAQDYPEVGEDIYILDSIGGVYAEQEDYKKAISYFEQALQIAQRVGVPEEEAMTLQKIGQAYYDLDEKEKALEYYLQALDLIDVMRSTMTVEELKSSFANIYREDYENTILLLMELGRDKDAFHYGERARARAFLDHMANSNIDIREEADAELLENEGELREKINELRIHLTYLRNRPSADWDTEAILTAEEELTSLETDYAGLLTTIKLQSPKVASLVSVDVASLEEIQALLDEDTTIVEYYVAKEQTLAFVIAKDSFEAVSLDVSRDELTQNITSFRDFAALNNAHPKSLVQLYEWLIAPLQDYIDTTVLIIVPHDILHYLPFAALTDGDSYLMDTYLLATSPSASALRFIHDKQNSQGNTILALGNPSTDQPPLNFAEQEVQFIANLYDTQPLVGEAAMESVIGSQANNASILHLAAHGEYNPYNPLFSAIYLASDDLYDGRLEVHEIYSLDLAATDLVVLSACQTNIGEVSAGDEIVGLTRSFMYAGTPTIISSLWNVDDESTALLMEKFYTFLKGGMGKAEAIRQAQIDVREQYPHPYYWAAFVLTGDPGKRTVVLRPRVSKPEATDVESPKYIEKSWFWAVVILGLGLVLLVSYGVYRNKYFH